MNDTVRLSRFYGGTGAMLIGADPMRAGDPDPTKIGCGVFCGSDPQENFTKVSGVTRVFGARGRSNEVRPPVESSHVSLTPTVRFFGQIPLCLCQAANYPAILLFSFNSMLTRKTVVGINR